jgi:hypothetical protein
MANTLFYQRLFWNAPVFGVVGVLFTQPAFAQGVGDIVRGLNAIMNPSDAQRLEDQARRNNRPAEERYWRDYRTGLESHDRTGDTGPRRDYGDHRFDPGDPRTFRSERRDQSRTRTAQPERATRIDEMTDRERRAFEDQLAEDAQRRYERMADAERQRYITDRQREQRRLGSARRW